MIALELYNSFMRSPSEHSVRRSAVISQLIQSLLELTDIITLIRAIGQYRILADIIRHIRLLLSGIRYAVSACLLYDMQRVCLAVAVGCRNGNRRAVARGNRHTAHAADRCVGVIGLDFNIKLLNRRIQLQAVICDIGVEALGCLSVDDDSIQQIISVYIQRRHCRRCLRHVVIDRDLEGQSPVQHLFGIGCLIGYGLCRRSLYVRHVLSIAAVNHIELMQVHGILAVPDIILRQILRAAGKRLQRIIPRTLVASRCRSVGKSIIDRAVAVGCISSDVEEIIDSFKALIGTGRQYRTGNALLGQNPGREIERADLTYLRRLHKRLRIGVILAVICRKALAVHEGALDDILYTLDRMGILLIGKLLKLEYARMIQEISRVEEIRYDLLGCTDPGFSVVTLPGTGYRIVGSLSIGLPGIRYRIIYQIPSLKRLCLYRLVPIEPCMLRQKYPVGILLMQASESGLIALRKALRVQPRFKIHIIRRVDRLAALDMNIL